MINLYYFVPISEVLGKGRRSIIYFQGCKKRCNGCFSVDSWDMNVKNYVKIESLVEKILRAGVDGVTISGGEPFLQYEGLLKLVKELKKNNLNIIVYSGYELEELEKFEEIFNYIDVLIAGEYKRELDFNTPLIGSINQKVVFFSDEGKELVDFMLAKKNREVEFFVKDNEVFIVGVPDKNFDIRRKL